MESQIHVNDLARGYVVLLHHIDTASPAESLDNPYFSSENRRDMSSKAIAGVIGRGRTGKIQSPEPRTIPEEDYKELFQELTGSVVGLHSRSRAVRPRQLG
ncbi:uncharacterized protein A1O9_00249 [Exophiala aquamarina CBS 119918]|uniref:Uncharacterized protein n=1 Tax=Exophiala aquamarina CBS 119918 TaxID=1182545 RepID=A0A072PRD5_9EURO|nr:uncharacterized protein A1O9_00249 [Exophiala aquamarina CBS 119918]KEF62277.1 hypothetical protein A1O9_00249 [Exophiala aquamarina CBS 119918]